MNFNDLKRKSWKILSYFWKRDVIKEFYGVKFKLDLSEDVQRNIFYGNYDREGEMSTILNLVNKDDVVLDIGSHIGIYALPTAKRVEYVYCFEPDPYNFSKLEENKYLNKITNITLENIAIAEEAGERTFFQGDKNTGKSSFSDIKAKEETTIRTTTLDDYILGKDVDSIKLIRMDIQGAELSALRGAGKTLEMTNSLLIEMHPRQMKALNQNPQDVFKILSNKGFECENLAGKEIKSTKLRQGEKLLFERRN